MDRSRLMELLERVAAGTLPADTAADVLAAGPLGVDGTGVDDLG